MQKSSFIYFSILIVLSLTFPIKVNNDRNLEIEDLNVEKHINGSFDDENHGSILIDGNDALDDFCSGNGTDGSESNPHVIEDYIIDAETEGYGISIVNTDQHLIIENCTILGNELEEIYGIYVNKCENISIQNCTIHECGTGIKIHKSEKTTCNNTDFINNELSLEINSSININVSYVNVSDLDPDIQINIYNTSDLRVSSSVFNIWSNTGISLIECNSTVIENNYFYAQSMFLPVRHFNAAISTINSSVSISNNTFEPAPTVEDYIITELNYVGALTAISSENSILSVPNNIMHTINLGIYSFDTKMNVIGNFFCNIGYASIWSIKGIMNISASRFTYCGRGIECISLDDLKIIDCHISHAGICPDDVICQGDGIYLLYYEPYGIDDFSVVYEIINTTIVQNNGFGIFVSRDLPEVNIKNCNISKNTDAGICIASSVYGARIENNYISDNLGHGVFLTDSSRNSYITGNYFNGNAGLCVYDCGRNNQYSNNTNCIPVTWWGRVSLWIIGIAGCISTVITIVVILKKNTLKSGLMTL